MRKFLIPLLLATAAASPAVAGPRHWSDNNNNNQQSSQDHQQAREQRAQEREQRNDARDDARAERQQMRMERTSPQQAGGNFARPDRMDAPQQSFGGRPDRVETRPDRGNFGGMFQRDVNNYAAPGPRMVTPPDRDLRAEQRAQQRQDRIDAREARQATRTAPRVIDSRGPVVSDVPRPGTQPPQRVEGRRGSDVQWSTNWRHDRRYDWRDYRHHHRSLFHLGLYFDPYGWGYQPFSIGWRLWPNYYSSRYWIQDPWMYRLPYAPPGTVWVRYFNDALLVDTWSGQVVDVIPGFFW